MYSYARRSILGSYSEKYKKVLTKRRIYDTIRMVHCILQKY